MTSLDEVLYLGTVVLLIFVMSLFSLFSLFLIYERQKYSHIPGPPVDNFFLGHIPSLKRCYDRDEYAHNQFLIWALEYKPIFKVFLLHQVMLLPTSEKLIKEFLTKSKYPKSKRGYDRFANICGARFLGNGFVTNTDHASWLKRRKAINPAFHRKHIQGQFMGRFNEVGDEWIESLREVADGETVVTMSESLCRVTLDAVGKVAFNMEVGALKSTSSPFPRAINKILEGMCITQRDPLLDWWPSLKTFCGEVRDAIYFLRSFGRQHLEERRRAMLAGQQVPDDLLTYLLRTLNVVDGLTLEDLLDDFDTLFVAGQETTSNSLSFLLGEIGRRPGILQRVKEEIKDVLGDRTEFRFEDVGKLTYLHQVWQETLRLYPPAPGTARDVMSDVVIDGIKIPAGSFIVVSFYVVHRLEQYYPNPTQFIPDRFKPGAKRHLFAYMPFSLAQRSCVGQQFANIESKLLVCKFLQNFDYTLIPNQSFEVQETTTLKPRGGTKLTLTSTTVRNN